MKPMCGNIHMYDESVWAQSGNTFVRGGGFLNGEYQAAPVLANTLETKNVDDLKETASDIKGFFSIISKIEGQIVVIVDRWRTIPICYAQTNSGIEVSDDPYHLRNRLQRGYDPTACAEYALLRFPIGEQTIFEGVNQVMPGSILIADCDTGDVYTERHFQWTHNQPKMTQSDIKQNLTAAVKTAADRLESVLNGRTAVIPLSGGYDSRRILLMLSEIGYGNVITYTTHYRASKESEVNTARSIARSMGYDWELVRSSHSDWYDFVRSPDYKRFKRATSAPCGFPITVDALSVQKLQKENRIPEDAVIVPGHTSADTVKYTPERFKAKGKISPSEVAKEVINTQQHDWKVSDDFEKVLVDKIVPRLTSDPVESLEQIWWEERKSKRISTSGLVYEFFGFDYWYPLHDPVFDSFWQRVPFNLKRSRSLYKEFIEEFQDENYEPPSPKISSTSEKDDTIMLINRLVSGTFLKPIASEIYRSIVSDSPSEVYDREIQFGAFSPERFGEIQNVAVENNHTGYYTLEMIDKLSFEDGEKADMPPEGEISIEWAASELK